MRFQEAYAGWQAGRLRQKEAGIEGLIDHRLNQVSHRRAAGGRDRGADERVSGA
jgi:hypothetical protein